MGENAFENANFNFAWEIPLTVTIYGKEFRIVASADAYYSTDEVTQEQENSYKFFMNDYKDIIANIEELLIKDAGSKENAIERYTPKFLKIKRNGDCGLVFDDKDDFENGLVITIRPQYQLKSTDEYF